jgi:hypothetical protein
MNSTWTSDKTQLRVDTLGAMFMTKVNYDETCVEFFFFIILLIKKDLLKKIHNSENTAAFLIIFKVSITTVLS